MIGYRSPLPEAPRGPTWEPHPRPWLALDATQAIAHALAMPDTMGQDIAEPDAYPRLAAWNAQEAAVKAMLGVEKLPNQTITAPEWREFERRVKAGDKTVATEIVMRRLRTTYRIASYYAQEASSNENHVSTEDLFQVGIVAMQTTIGHYADGKERKSSLSDLVDASLNAVVQCKALESGLVRIPIDHVEELAVLEAAQAEIANKQGLVDPHAASLADLLEATDWDPWKLRDYLALQRTTHRRARFLPADVLEAQPATDPDRVIPDAATLTERDLAHKLFELLSERERTVIEHRMGIGGKSFKTLAELGAMYGRSVELIRQIETQSLRKLAGHHLARGYSARMSRDRVLSSTAENERIIERLGGLVGTQEPYKSIQESGGLLRATYARAISDALDAMQRDGITAPTKHELAEKVAARKLPPSPTGLAFSYAEYVQALNALSEHGALWLTQPSRLNQGQSTITIRHFRH